MLSTIISACVLVLTILVHRGVVKQNARIRELTTQNELLLDAVEQLRLEGHPRVSLLSPPESKEA